MKSTIHQLALELGFDACRFTSAAPPESSERFKDWLASGHHGAMEYLQRNAEKRLDPQKVLAGATTIVTLAASYAAGRFGANQAPKGPARESAAGGLSKPASSSEVSSVIGEVARYAQYIDYHDILADRLRTLTERINQLGGSGTRSLWYVDTGPILERDLAQRAGIGFVGKHTNLISRQLGNWFFLAEILTTVTIEPDNPEKNRCGSCSRCITACPTQAITGPFQLDARRCISYLTIELKGSIPVEFRPALGKRIYGCDACLDACPWNRFARQGRILREHYRNDLSSPDLLQLLSLNEAGFKARFAGTPMLRTKRRGVLRNVCVALGNIGDETVLPALRSAARDPEPLIAEHAQWAIDQIDGRTRSDLK